MLLVDGSLAVASNFELFNHLRRVVKGKLVFTCKKLSPFSEPLLGFSDVTIFSGSVDSITFHEKGKWVKAKGRDEITYTNTLRFRMSSEKKVILEHLRYGQERPVQLLELYQISSGHYKSLSPHLCKEDVYSGEILFDNHYIYLNWQITGSKKNALIKAVYTSRKSFCRMTKTLLSKR